MILFGFMITLLMGACGLFESEDVTGPDLAIAKRAVEYLKRDQLDSLKSISHSSLIESMSSPDWAAVTHAVRLLHQPHIQPVDSLMRIVSTTQYSVGSPKTMTKVSFAYRYLTAEDKVNYINVAVSEQQLYFVDVEENPWAKEVE